MTVNGKRVMYKPPASWYDGPTDNPKESSMFASFNSPFEVIREYVLWTEAEETQAAHDMDDDGALFHAFADEINLDADDRHDVAELLFHPTSGLLVPFDETA
jgi:hypothetical protein